jgi:GNAT superfamily N-acetyltransferase
MEVRQARPADWEVLRELRLRALADAPDAFASTLKEEAASPEQVWRRRAEGGAGSVGFIACEDGAGIGMATVLPEADIPGRLHLVGMWVHPRHRRRGVAKALVEQAVGWARDHRAREVVLWVVDTNIPARRLYERAGFQPTGDRQPLPSNPALTESSSSAPSRGARCSSSTVLGLELIALGVGLVEQVGAVPLGGTATVQPSSRDPFLRGVGLDGAARADGRQPPWRSTSRPCRRSG